MTQDFVQTAAGDIVNLSTVKRVQLVGSTVIFYHVDNTQTSYAFASGDEAITFFIDLEAILGPSSVSDPLVYSMVPSSMAVTSGPIAATITGKSFDATAQAFLVNASGSFSLGAAFVDSTQLTATVPNSLGVGVYDLIYTDDNGKVFRKPNAFNVY